jgi:hypothetical protein
MENIKLTEDWKAEAERAAEIPGNYLQGAQAVLTAVEKILLAEIPTSKAQEPFIRYLLTELTTLKP